MSRVFFLVPAIAIIFAASISAAQQISSDPSVSIPVIEEDLGAPLIAWTDMQAPRPEPAPNVEANPAPSPENPEPSQPEAAPSQNSSPDASQDQAPVADTFTGTVSKDGDSYVLKASVGSSYKLDDQEKAKACEGQRVKVTGVLDGNNGLIHVQKIEPLS